MDTSWMMKPKAIREYIEQSIPHTAAEYVDDKTARCEFMWQSQEGGVIYTIARTGLAYMRFPAPCGEGVILKDILHAVNHSLQEPVIIRSSDTPCLRFLTPDDDPKHAIEFNSDYAVTDSRSWLHVPPFMVAHALFRSGVLEAETEQR